MDKFGVMKACAMRTLLAFLMSVMFWQAFASGGMAQDRVTLGWSRFLNNDAIGEARDRWQTGSFAVSRIRGVEWSGDLPARFGEILEFRVEGRVIAPEDMVFPAPWDRRLAGVLSFGLHSHFAVQGWDATAGVDLVMVGPQTGMSRIQGAIHDIVGLPKPRVFGAQLGNAVYPTAVLELGREVDLAGSVHLRPFVEVQAGAETFVRAGADVVIGRFGAGSLMLRDRTTGQRYIGVKGEAAQGFSVVLGGDVARMFDSHFLPSSGVAQLADTRSRLRAGVNWQGKRASVFYGLTYLGKEFTAQPEGQLVGSLNLRLRY